MRDALRVCVLSMYERPTPTLTVTRIPPPSRCVQALRFSVVASFVAARGTQRAGCFRPSVAVFVGRCASIEHARLLPRGRARLLRTRTLYLPVQARQLRAKRAAPAPSLAATLHNAPLRTGQRSRPRRRSSLLFTVAPAGPCAMRRYAKWPQATSLCLVAVRRSRRRIHQPPARCAAARRPWLAAS
jgi:hypothetical protein